MESPIEAYRVDITRQGGYIKGRTTSGKFSLGPLGFDLIGAIATVVRGLNASYDDSANCFSCWEDNSSSTMKLIAKVPTGPASEESTIKAAENDSTTFSNDSNEFPRNF